MIDGMTDARLPVSAAAEAGAVVPARLADRLRTPLVLLNVAGIVLVAVAIVPAHGRPPVGVAALGAVALAGWLAWVLEPTGRPRDATMVVSALTAAVGAGLGAPSLLAPVIAALVVGMSDTTRSPRLLGVLAGAVAVALTVAAVVHGQALEDLLSLLAGVALGVLGGITRRQRKTATLQERELLERSLAAERETQRAELLEARGAAARDVHDVLAHSLGGLVLQLDAIEALLEHGRIDEATARATAARRLAGDGLSEARRAVAALRDPEAAAPVMIPDDALPVLVEAHRALGAAAETEGDPTLGGLDAVHREAIAGALREALVNARRHAPGEVVHVGFARTSHAMTVRVTNPLPVVPAIASVGDGHGLVGMRERFASLGDGSSVSAGRDGGAFVVDATAVLP
jgi:signal transduction histidine kinase